MRITARELNRSTLDRQLLLRREPLDVVDAVRRVVAIQAQQAASPYVALWNRLTGFDPGDLDAAFTGRTIVKATLMRITLHAVHADDYQAFHAAMQPTLRAARLNDRFTASGLSTVDADALLPDLLDFADRPRTGAEMEAWLEERFGVPREPGAWWGLRAYAPLLHAPTGGPWSFGPRPSYVAALALPTFDEEATAKGLRELIQRYLEGFGPASMPDIAQFAMVTRARVKAAIDGAFERFEGPDGTVLYDVPGAPHRDGDTPAPPRLMAMWDSILLAHADRSRFIPPDYRKLVIRTNGDVLPTLLVDGHVAGVWRPVDDGIEATTFHRLPADAWDGLAAEAQALLALLADRDPRAYRRYDRWWTSLPTEEVRVIGR